MTIQEFFNKYPWIKAGEIAKRAGISHSLIRQYACGDKVIKSKELRQERTKALENAIREIGNELAQVRLK